MTEVGVHVITGHLDRIVEHHGAAQRAAERAHDTHARIVPPADTAGEVIPTQTRNPAAVDRTPRA